MWVRVFNLHFPDKMEILSPQGEVGRDFLNCGCEFSNLHFLDKMKSCRHKRYRQPPHAIDADGLSRLPICPGDTA